MLFAILASKDGLLDITSDLTVYRKMSTDYWWPKVDIFLNIWSMLEDNDLELSEPWKLKIDSGPMSLA